MSYTGARTRLHDSPIGLHCSPTGLHDAPIQLQGSRTRLYDPPIQLQGSRTRLYDVPIELEDPPIQLLHARIVLLRTPTELLHAPKHSGVIPRQYCQAGPFTSGKEAIIQTRQTATRNHSLPRILARNERNKRNRKQAIQIHK